MVDERNYWARSGARRISRRVMLRGTAAGGTVLVAGLALACGSNNNNSSNSAAPAASASAAGSRPATAAASAPAASRASGASPAASTKHVGFVGGFQTSGVGQTLSPNSTALWASEYYAIFDQLARLEPAASGAPTVTPALALKWENTSPTQWVFHLRPEAKWSDGQPVTSADVKFTYEYIKDATNKSSIIGRVGTIASVDATDPQTVTLNTMAPDPLIPREAFFVHIYPQHYMGDPKNGDQAMGTKPIGSGAYIADSYSQGSGIKLTKSPTSWRGTKGVDTIDMRIIGQDSTRMAAFQSGEVDMVDGVPFDQINALQQGKNKVFSPPATGYLGWDMEYFDAPYSDKRG